MIVAHPSMKPLTKKYLPEITALRAIAVLLVLLFHLDFSWLPGGFIGVDVFFVISGYLITRNILISIDKGNFSFFNFYTKRLRRLFPALFFTLVFCIIAGWFFLAPANLERLGQSIIYAAIYLSNFFFLGEQGYFETDSALKPLLHTWSLSIEEQFYLIWPLIIAIGAKWGNKKLGGLLLLLTVLSISAAQSYFFTSAKSVFFLLPFRVFEFALGALILWGRHYLPKSNLMLESLALLGVGAIIASACLFDGTTPMPGLLSLVPCIGTMLVIFAGTTPRLGAIFKTQIFALIGKSSYSIYLIHWPLIVYYKYWKLDILSSTDQAVLGAVSLVLGYLMWQFVEKTFRYATPANNRVDRIWIAMPALSLLLVFGGYGIWANKGIPDRYSNEYFLSAAEIKEERDRYWQQSTTDLRTYTGSTGKSVIIMGNSHATDLIYSLVNNGFENGIHFFGTSYICYNFGTSPHRRYDQQCTLHRQKYFLRREWRQADAIYLHDDWQKKDFANLKIVLADIRRITTAPIFVFGPKMVFNKQVPDIVHACQSAFPNSINRYAASFIQPDRIQLNTELINFFADPQFRQNNTFYIDMLAVQNDYEAGLYEVVSSKNKKFLYFDGGHFTEQGATEFGERLKYYHSYVFDLVF